MKKGFTLIELLAVIVILAIIALIATPIILGIINNAKKESDKRSVELYVKAAELAVARKNLTSEFKPTTCNVLNGACTCDGVEIQIDVDNGSSINGTITFNEKGVVTSNTLVSKKIETVSFAEDDWETIALLKNSGTYHVGDTKEIDMGTFGTHTVRIANTTPCDGTLESETACGFVLEFVDVITNHKMNPSGEYKGSQYDYGWNVDGWPASEMRTYVNTDIYNALPEELRNAIIDTTVVSGHGSTSGETNFTSTDKLYLLSTKEVWNGGTGYDTAEAETRQLDYYANNGVTTSNYSSAIKKDSLGIASSWWLRTARSWNSNSFYAVLSGGDWNYHTPYYSDGVSPAFRI